MKLSIILPSILSTASLAAAYVGGPCAKNFNKDGDCICLHQKTCTSKWNGQVVTGKKGNWPCPDDENDVKGCVISDCDSFFSLCKWTSDCPKNRLGPRR